MRTFRSRSIWFSAVLLSATLFFAGIAQAGPPLICHAFQIGTAKSLPWNNSASAWSINPNDTYDIKNLAADTLAILQPGTPVIVRMETLRRATLYARQDPIVAKELLVKVYARAKASESAGTPDALAWFDAGYLVETYRQWIGKNMPHMTDGLRMDANPASGLDGYSFVKKAITLRGDDPQMEFAAALITLTGSSAEQRAHAEKAVAGAKSDVLLAQNLATRLTGPQTETMTQLIAQK
jgi:hypothetical protein